MNQDAIDTAIAEIPLHDPAYGRVFACMASEAVPLSALAYDMRCQACFDIACTVAMGEDPVTLGIDDKTGEQVEWTLKMFVGQAILKYDWPVKK